MKKIKIHYYLLILSKIYTKHMYIIFLMKSKRTVTLDKIVILTVLLLFSYIKRRLLLCVFLTLIITITIDPHLIIVTFYN